MKITEAKNVGMDGVHKFTFCDIRSPKALALQQEIVHILETIKSPNMRYGVLFELYRELERLFCVKQFEVHNIIPTAGRTVIAQRITGTNTYTLNVNYGSLGTSATAPANGDTQLTTETYRKAISSRTNSNNIAYLSNFYTATEVTGTFEEAGWHIDGTASANTGQLLSHFLTTTTTKSSVQTLTVESTITVS